MPGTVVVCCKLPHGITVQAFQEFESFEPTPQGSRPVKAWKRVGKAYPCKGVAVPMGHEPGWLMNGYALTRDVDADVWQAWLQHNHEAPYIKNRMVFAFAKESDVMNETRAMEGVRSGLEPIDPQNLRREYGGGQTAGGGRISALEQAPESAKPR